MEEGNNGSLQVNVSSISVGDVTTKAKPIRRKYEEAFVSTTDVIDDDEGHIVPEASFPVDLLQGVSVSSSSSLPPSSKPSAKENPSTITCQVPVCQQTFESAQEYQRHYDGRHKHSCATCKKSLPSDHILELHVLEIHDTLFSLMAEKKPMYQCFLETCSEKFSTTSDRKAHCLEAHKFPEKFQYWNCAPPKSSKNKSNGKTKTKDKNKNKESTQMKNLPDLVPDDTIKIDPTNSTASGSEVKVKSVPKHISFGHAPHRSFKVRQKFAMEQPKPNKSVSAAEDEKSMDMAEIGKALSLNPASNDNGCQME